MTDNSVFKDFKIKWQEYIVNRSNISNVKVPSDNFLYWFIGFVEGLNAFKFCRKREPEFRLVILKSKFKNILTIIYNELQLGTIISTYFFGNKKKWSALSISKKEELQLLVMLFEGNLIIKKQKEMYFVFREQVKKLYSVLDWRLYEIINEYKPTKYDTWLLGFTEAKGIFTCSLLFHSLGFKTRFMICSTSFSDVAVYSGIWEIFGIGQLQRWKNRNSYCFVISGVKNIKAIYSYFDKYVSEFRTNKKQTYLLFKEVNTLLALKKHLDLDQREHIKELCYRINNSK